jgi:hypothetical protein
MMMMKIAKDSLDEDGKVCGFAVKCSDYSRTWLSGYT